VLIPSHYATSPHTRSLRPVRVPSDQNTRWRLPFHFRPIDDKNFLSPHICQISLHFRFKVGIILFRRDARVTCDINHNFIIKPKTFSLPTTRTSLRGIINLIVAFIITLHPRQVARKGLKMF